MNEGSSPSTAVWRDFSSTPPPRSGATSVLPLHRGPARLQSSPSTAVWRDFQFYPSTADAVPLPFQGEAKFGSPERGAITE